MTKLPIDLALKTMTNKVSVDAHARLGLIAKSHGFKKQDVLSACLLHMPEDEIVRICEAQKAMLEKLPKSIQAVLKNADTMTEADRKILRDMLA